jgi:hypothetical protein
MAQVAAQREEVSAHVGMRRTQRVRINIAQCVAHAFIGMEYS